MRFQEDWDIGRKYKNFCTYLLAFYTNTVIYVAHIQAHTKGGRMLVVLCCHKYTGP